jgi:hypothetical protein
MDLLFKIIFAIGYGVAVYYFYVDFFATKEVT